MAGRNRAFIAPEQMYAMPRQEGLRQLREDRIGHRATGNGQQALSARRDGLADCARDVSHNVRDENIARSRENASGTKHEG